MIDNIMASLQGTKLTGSDCEGSLYSLAIIQQMWRSMYLDTFKTATLNKKAPSVTVVTLRDYVEKDILDFQKKNRPLVLNFGSCT